MLHLVVTTGGVAVFAAISAIPQARSIVKGSWEWLKGLFAKHPASSPGAFVLDFSGKTEKVGPLRGRSPSNVIQHQFIPPTSSKPYPRQWVARNLMFRPT